jgi:hypothetical protein
LGAKLEEVGIRHAEPAIGLREILSADRHEPRATGHGHRFEQHGIHERKHRRVDADAEGQRDDDGEGEQWMRSKHPQGETEVGLHVGAGLHRARAGSFRKVRQGVVAVDDEKVDGEPPGTVGIHPRIRPRQRSTVVLADAIRVFSARALTCRICDILMHMKILGQPAG